MYFPPIQKNEYLLGYQGRLAAVNNCDSIRSLFKRMVDSGSAAGQLSGGKRSLDFVASVSVALDMPSYELVSTRSLWPISSALRDRSDTSEVAAAFGGQWSPRYRGDRLALCARCAADDLAEEGLSFWRVQHQVPGSYRCDVHGDVLQFVLRDFELAPQPHKVAQDACPPDRDALDHADRDRAAQAAHFLLTALMQGQRIGNPAECKSRVMDEVQQYFGWARRMQVPALLADHFSERIPRAWMEDFFPNLRRLNCSGSFLSLGVANSKNVGAIFSLVLLAAYMRESVQGAVQLLGIQGPGDQRVASR